MIKAIGQNGLNFIANKYKELKELVDRKVDKVDGKSLSTNDYTNEAKKKVDAIPANPKYTDTVTSVVDNLTTDDGTKALSAKQGKALQDNKADKSNISRCKAKGYNTSNIWQDLGTERDLEDWIGDFDKRTRELKSNKGLTGASSEFKTQLIECDNARNLKLQAAKWGRIVQLYFYFVYDSNSSTTTSWTFTIPKEFIPAGRVFGVMFNGDFEIFPNSNNSNARMTVRKDYQLRGGEIAGNVMYFSRWQ